MGKRGDGWVSAMKYRCDIEALEQRALLATGAFTAPDLTGLIRQAVHHGVNTGPEVIYQMTAALEDQLAAGPLAELQAGTITSTEFEDLVAAVVDDYAFCVDDLLGARFPHITDILIRQGTKVEADLAAIATEQTVGLIDQDGYDQAAAGAIVSLTGGPLRPIHTPLSGYASVTDTYVAALDGVVAGLDAALTSPLTVAEAQSVVSAVSEAYLANLRSALALRPGVLASATQSVDDLLAVSDGLTDADAQATLGDAVDVLHEALVGKTGLFGPKGAVAWHLHR